MIGADGVIRYQSPAFERSQLQPGVPTIGEVHMRALGDEQAPRRFEMTATDLLDDPTVRGLVLNYRDIAERALFQERLTQQAFHDALTGLPNRALFQDRLEHALRQEGNCRPAVRRSGPLQGGQRQPRP